MSTVNRGHDEELEVGRERYRRKHGRERCIEKGVVTLKMLMDMK